MSIKSILFLTFTILFFRINSQNNIEYKNKIYKEGIKTVLFYRAGWEFTYPVLELNSDKKLVLSFDDLNDDITDYYYTIIHCTADWNVSDLNPLEYISGYEENQIENFENSFNTLVQYTHYTLIFPNEDMRPTISGNYLLLVYEDYDKSKPVLTRRFYVVDNKLSADIEIRRSSLVSDMNTSQELIIKVKDNSGYVTDPQDNFSITVLKNNDQNFILSNLKPDFIKGNVYEFYNPRILKFKGGNEFRYFNTKSVKYVNDRIMSIQFKRPYYIFELVKEEPENSLTYSYAQDINGELLITAEKVENPELEAEYVFVDFSFYRRNPFPEGDVYVYGAVSDNDCNKYNRMTYDYGIKAYKLRMLLKQGFYNYEYVICRNGDNTPDLSLTEGNYYQTENNYLVFIYNRPHGGLYDELTGYKIANSLKIF